MGVSHSKYLEDGSQVSICTDLDMETFQPGIVVFKIRPETPFKREIISRIPSSKVGYQHAFAMTENHLVIFDSPFYVDLMGMFFGQDIGSSMKYNSKDTTLVHAVNL